MDNTASFELCCESLTKLVQNSPQPDYCKLHYLKQCLALLWTGNRFEFEEDLLVRFAGLPLGQILEENPHLLAWGHAANPTRDGELFPIYFDLFDPHIIEKKNELFDVFFAHMLAHQDIFNIDNFLSYQLIRNFENDLVKMNRFLHLLIRKYKDSVLSEDAMCTAQEWVSSQVSQPQPVVISDGYLAVSRKSIVRRKSEDRITCLSQAQTVLLFTFLQHEKVFFGSGHLTDANAGKAFEILTGYSHNTLRQDFSKYRQLLTKDNLTVLKRLTMKLMDLIGLELGEVKYGHDLSM
jgi:hypothetical protein